MTELPEKFVIRNSDRVAFKKCRMSWDFSSKLRQGIQSFTSAEPLEFGTATHEAMEVIYGEGWETDPPPIVTAEAITRFMDYMKGWRQRLIDLDLFYGTYMEARMTELMTLGKGMLPRYMDYALANDSDWERVHTEIEFEVPIPVRDPQLKQKITTASHSFFIDGNCAWFDLKEVNGIEDCLVVTVEITNDIEHKYLKYEYGYVHIPVYHQGRIDNLFRKRSTGKIWVWDHKTTSQIQNDYFWLDLDTQGGTYLWAVREVLGIDAEGVLFNFLLKELPAEPRILQSGKVSKDKSQRTTKAKLTEAITRNPKCNIVEYATFLRDFEEAIYFHREEIYRSNNDLDSIGVAVALEAMDMIGDPSIYTNPSQFNCQRCAFKHACRIRQDGGNPMDVLSTNVTFGQNLFEETA